MKNARYNMYVAFIDYPGCYWVRYYDPKECSWMESFVHSASRRGVAEFLASFHNHRLYGRVKFFRYYTIDCVGRIFAQTRTDCTKDFYESMLDSNLKLISR